MRSNGVAVVEEINVGFVADSGPGVRFVSVNVKAIAVGEATFEGDIAGRGGAVARFERKAGLKGRDAQKFVVEFLSDKRVGCRPNSVEHRASARAKAVRVRICGRCPKKLPN